MERAYEQENPDNREAVAAARRESTQLQKLLTSGKRAHTRERELSLLHRCDTLIAQMREATGAVLDDYLDTLNRRFTKIKTRVAGAKDLHWHRNAI